MAAASTCSDVISRTSLALATPYAAPDRELETLITTIFAEAFGLDHVGANDDFFDLGGDSLIAEVLSMCIGERTGHDFPPSSLVEFGSPRRIAELLDKRLTESVVAFQGEGNRPPIFVVHGRGGFTLPEPTFFQALAKGQRLRMFELPGIRAGRCYEHIEHIAAVYVAQLCDEYPQGPIFLAAFCAGGLIALEMAAQLAEMGRPICQLVLLDPPIRHGTLGVGLMLSSGQRARQDWVKAVLRRLLPMRVLCRYHDLKYRMILLRKRRAGSLRYADFGFSIKAQAKLYVAFLRYQARPYPGPVTILSSSGSSRASRGGARLGDLLPQMRIRLVAETHRGIGGSATAARTMQSVFDGALGMG